MAKGTDKGQDKGAKDPEEKARRKLEKAIIAVEVAREKHSQARLRGKQEIEQARLRAARWETKAAERVERKVRALEKADARARELCGDEVADGQMAKLLGRVPLESEGQDHQQPAQNETVAQEQIAR